MEVNRARLTYLWMTRFPPCVSVMGSIPSVAPGMLSYMTTPVVLFQILIRNVVGVAVVDERDLEPVVAAAIDRARTLVPRLLAAGVRATGDVVHDEPVERRRVEVDVANLALELGLAVGCRGAVLVLGDEAEVVLAADVLARRPRAGCVMYPPPVTKPAFGS